MKVAKLKENDLVRFTDLVAKISGVQLKSTIAVMRAAVLVEDYFDTTNAPKYGDFMVRWPHRTKEDNIDIEVRDLNEAREIVDLLKNYDIFQFADSIGYLFQGYMMQFVRDVAGSGEPGWEIYPPPPLIEIDEDDPGPLVA